MSARTYLLCGLLLYITACKEKVNPDEEALQREADDLYAAAVRQYDAYPDSALHLGRELLTLARDKMKDSTEVTRAYTVIGYTHYIKGNYPQALDTFQRALDIDNEFNLEKYKGTHTNHIGNIYKSLENYDTARQKYLAADSIARRGWDMVMASKNWDSSQLKSYDTVRAVAALNLGYIYEKKAGEQQRKQGDMQPYIDSAFAWEYLALHLAETVRHRKNLDIVYNNLGKIHRLQGNVDSAKYYFRKAIDSSVPVLDTRGRGEAHVFLAELFSDLKQYDSALDHGMMGLEDVENSSYPRGRLMSVAVLAHAFEKLNKSDRAFYYLKEKDSTYRQLFSISNVQQMQISAIEHKNMEIQRAREKKEAIDRRDDQLERYAILLVISIGIVFLVVAIRKKIRNRWLTMAATVIILMLFEFVNEIIYPPIEHLLESSSWPMFNKAAFVWFFLIAVLLAIFLFNPAHHWLERWFKGKLGASEEVVA